MKKLIFTILIYLLPLCLQLSDTAVSHASNLEIYAKVTSENANFYSHEDPATALFVVPESYFVLLTGEKNDFYIARYKDCTGYVRKSDVSAMNGSPSNPFFTSSVRMFLPSGSYLYSAPAITEANQITKIDYLSEGLSFYGSIIGDEAIPKKSKVWHYCKFETGDFGYVYSVFCDELTTPPKNTETFEVITPNFQQQAPSGPSPTAMAFIIIGVSLPCLIVLYLLVKPNVSNMQSHERAIKIKRRPKRDYFEFDEGDLT